MHTCTLTAPRMTPLTPHGAKPECEPLHSEGARSVTIVALGAEEVLKRVTRVLMVQLLGETRVEPSRIMKRMHETLITTMNLFSVALSFTPNSSNPVHAMQMRSERGEHVVDPTWNSSKAVGKPTPSCTHNMRIELLQPRATAAAAIEYSSTKSQPCHCVSCVKYVAT